LFQLRQLIGPCAPCIQLVNAGPDSLGNCDALFRGCFQLLSRAAKVIPKFFCENLVASTSRAVANPYPMRSGALFSRSGTKCCFFVNTALTALRCRCGTPDELTRRSRISAPQQATRCINRIATASVRGTRRVANGLASNLQWRFGPGDTNCRNFYANVASNRDVDRCGGIPPSVAHTAVPASLAIRRELARIVSRRCLVGLRAVSTRVQSGRFLTPCSAFRTNKP